jgi:hypothetical protein
MLPDDMLKNNCEETQKLESGLYSLSCLIHALDGRRNVSRWGERQRRWLLALVAFFATDAQSRAEEHGASREREKSAKIDRLCANRDCNKLIAPEERGYRCSRCMQKEEKKRDSWLLGLPDDICKNAISRTNLF